jgi:acetyl esterase
MVELKRPLTTIVVALACLTVGLPAEAAPPDGEPVVYKSVGDRDLTLYVTKPDDWQAGDRRPCIVFYHGGGWVGGKPGQFTEHAKHFCGRGLVCVQVEYRLLDRKGNDPPDACIHDARSAMRWVRSHADRLGIDPLRIASAGGSAGGHLAGHVGMVDGLDDPRDNTAISCKSQAMLLFNPVFDNGPGGWGTQRVGDRYAEISPLHNISPDDPPAVVFLGTEDKLIPVATGRRFEEQMNSAGVACKLHLYEGQPHGFFNHGRDGNRWYNETIAAADKFLESLGWLDAGS